MPPPTTDAPIGWWAEPPLVGRETLIAELESAAAAAAAGHGSIVLLCGEAGIGKTRVARALAQRVDERLAVSWGVCAADESAPPFWPWRPLVALDAIERPRPVEQAIGVPRFEHLTTLADRVHHAAGDQPRLHVLEDMQWADVASVLLLAHLGATIGDAPLLVVASLRSGELRSPQLDDAIDQVRRTSHVRHLAALSDDDIAAMLRSAGVQPDERLTGVVRSRTGGNPLLLSELLRAVRLTDSVERRVELVLQSVPARVSELVEHRMSRLPQAVAKVLRVAAVIGSEGDVATLARTFDGDPESVLDLLDQARAAQFLDAAGAGRWRFHHQLVRDAVYAGVGSGDRARDHARVVDAMAADPSTSPSTLAFHALAGQPLFDADRAVALAARAGELALAQHAYEEAITWFTQALEAAPPETAARWRAELLVRSGEAQRHIGAIDRARQSFLEAAELTDDPELLARAALGYADPGADLGIAYRTGDATTAALLDRALAAQPALESPTGVQIEARLAAELYFSDEPERSRSLARSALDRARRLGDPRSLGIATAVNHDAFVVGQAPLDVQLAESTQLLEWARQAGSVSALLMAHRARVFDLLAAGEIDAVDAEIVAFRRLAEPLRAPGYLWWPDLWSAMRALLEGRHDIAEQRALAAYHTGARPFPTLSFVNLSFLLFFLRREQGRLAEMEQATRDYAASHADVPAIRVGLTFLLAELGRIDEARGSLSYFDDAALARLHDRNWPASWFQLARASFVAEDRELAARLLRPEHRPTELCVQVSLATVCLGSTDLAAAWLLHATGDVDDAARHYESGARLNARIGARSWLAQARADHARLLVARDRPGDREAAGRLADLARAAADQIGLATIGDVPASDRHRGPASAAILRSGSVWHLEFADRAVQVGDARGLRDLAYLVTRPGEAISVLELAHEAGAPRSTARGAPTFDAQARRHIRRRLHELDAAEASAEADGDGEAAALIREQRRELAESVARDLGLGGRARRIDDPVERARKTVSTRIRRAIAHIARVHPELGRHLDRSIDTGAWCAYRPAEPIDWRT